MSTMTHDAKMASKGTFALVTGLAFAVMIAIALVTSIVSGVLGVIVLVVLASGYAVYRHVVIHGSRQLASRPTGSARLVGGDAAHSGLGVDRDPPR